MQQVSSLSAAVHKARSLQMLKCSKQARLVLLCTRLAHCPCGHALYWHAICHPEGLLTTDADVQQVGSLSAADADMHSADTLTADADIQEQMKSHPCRNDVISAHHIVDAVAELWLPKRLLTFYFLSTQ
ncbi:hypothetical protein NDU88_005161 [Pleurodeles waltl]|uniref:Uncharacterized protein n=1 Tax=Pleurodeles waltl TaxID=8319 RepID=A0AAV7LBR5_PLEWA|nr:hypothetical protein NDU88_005161 [Pleurodeles waltl]